MSVSAAARTPTRRNVELALLLVSVLFVFVFAAAVDIALLNDITSTVFVLTAVFAAVVLALHMTVRVLAPYADPMLLPCAVTLTGVGVVFLRRLELTSTFLNDEDTLEPLYPTVVERAGVGVFEGTGGRHLLYFLIAALALGIFLWVVRDHRTLSRYAYTMGLAGVALAAIPGFLPASISQGEFGAKSWIIIGPISVQPGEFAKLLLMGFFAYYLVRKREVLSLASKKFLGLHFPRARDIVPILVVCFASVVILVLESDLGSSLMYFGVFVAMLYIATERSSWILIGLGAFSAGAVLAHSLTPRLQLRVRIWTDPWDPHLYFETGESYQLVQSLMGLGSGGLFGSGPGRGHPELIPIVESDFIISGLGEEVGLFGLTAVLMIYLLLVERGMRTALAVRDLFGKLLAGGLAFAVGFQVFVIIAGITRIIPMTGITAPFISAGGSSLLANWILIAVLIRMSHAARKPQTPSAGPVKVAPPPTPGDDSPTELVPAASRDETEIVDVAQAADPSRSEPEAPPNGYGAESPPTNPEVR
ncbi:MAG: FtsW/RodA/SpoVE family cell cycle protein [Stackebrandtia sp.]